MDNQSYTWTDNPTVSGVSPCNTDVLNECLMHLKYNQQNGDGFRLFDIKITDRKLVGEEAVGWVIQGGLVTMTYPDAVNKIIEEFDEGVPVTQREISCVQSLTGHYIADIEQKEAIDLLFAQTGIADFYILDKTNQQFYLPRNKWFMQLTTDDTLLNGFNEAGLPNHQHSPIYLTGSNADAGDPGSCYMTNNGQQNGVQTSTNSRTGNVSNNSLYGKSDTVQPQSSNKLVYYKVGNVSTSTNQILIDAQEFLADSVQELEDTAQEGLDIIESAIDNGVASISNVSNALKQNQIADCILEAPNGVASFTTDTITLKQGLKLLIPNGRNADATLNNIEYTLSADLSKTLSEFSNTTDYVFFVYDEQTPDVMLELPQKVYYGILSERPEDGSCTLYYASDTNYWYCYSDEVWNIIQICKIASVSTSTEAITALNTYDTLRLINANDTDFLSHQSMPSAKYIDLSFPTNGATYISPADGWFQLNGAAGYGPDKLSYHTLNNGTAHLSIVTTAMTHVGQAVYIPAAKGDAISVTYSSNVATDGRLFRFIYSKGAQYND